MGYWLYDHGSILCKGKILFSSPQRSDRFWSPPSLLSNGYRGLSPRGLSGRDVKLTIHLHLIPRSKIVELYLHSPKYLYGIVLNYVIKYSEIFTLFTGK
jgi:hypothetical protein